MAKPLETKLTKKPHQKLAYTPEQLKEFGRCADKVNGPFYFANNFVWVQHSTKGRIPYKSYSYQSIMLDTMHNYRLSVFLCGRQLGKSITSAIYLLWYASFTPDTTILIVANIYATAKELMDRIRFMYENIPDHIRPGVIEYNKQSITFDNGSRIISRATTPTSGRGLSIGILYVDELSFVAAGIQKEFYSAISPTLSSGGKCIISSTPMNNEDQFAQIWQGANKTEDEFGNPFPNGVGENGFKSFKAIWSEHPERDEEWMRIERANLGEEKFLREHCCISGDSIVTIKFPNGTVEEISISALKDLLRS